MEKEIKREEEGGGEVGDNCWTFNYPATNLTFFN